MKWFSVTTVFLVCSLATQVQAAGLFGLLDSSLGGSSPMTGPELAAPAGEDSVVTSGDAETDHFAPDHSIHRYVRHESWMGGCCERQHSCCCHIWDGFCHQQRQAWHTRHGCGTKSCMPKIQLCLPGLTCGQPRGCRWHPFAWLRHCLERRTSDCGCGDCDGADSDDKQGGSGVETDVQQVPAPAPETADPPPPAPVDQSAGRWLLPPRAAWLPATF